MHEVVFANKVIEKAKGYGDVKGIKVEVGELAEVSADELRDALKKLVKWNVNVEEKEALVKCKCGYEGKPRILERGHHTVLFNCSKCGNLPEVVNGNEINLVDVEVK